MSYVSDAASPLSAALNDYFRIPTPEDMLLKISMYKDSSGLITELNVNSTFDEDSGVSTPTFEVHSAVTEQGCFFTFSGHCYDVDSNRYPLNIGNVQGGAGVYFLPYTSGTSREKGVKYVDLEGFGSVYAFENEEVSPQELHVLEDGQTLLLTTQEGKTLYLNVIDLTTGKRAQKLPLMDMGERSLRHVWYEDGFLVHLCYDDCFVLSQLTETGYEVRIKGVLGEGESMDKACYADLVDLAYNGEKLGVVFPIYRTESYYANASIGVMVYDTTGLLYSGTHISSLDTGSEEYRQRVTCSDGQPLMVHWVS